MTYNDPLHVSYVTLTIFHEPSGKGLILNKGLLDRQNCWENLDLIKELHYERLELEAMMAKSISEKEAYLDLVEGACDKMMSHDLISACNKAIEKELNQYNDFLMFCNAYYTLIEFELQKAWGFSQDKNFHRFWNRPGCSCPTMDNDDRYPYGSYIITGGCSLHSYSAPPTFWDKIKRSLNGFSK